MLTTAITRLLGIPHPVMLAPMDIVADARLTLAVSDAGGFGILGGGYGDPVWLERELQLLEEANAARQSLFGIGFITWSLAYRPHLLDRALLSKPSAIWLSFGDPAPFVDKISAAGVMLICQVQTVPMAKEAVAKGADIIVAQGTEAGGHGTSCGSIALTPAIVDAVADKVPVVMAGGIADGRGLAAALMLGAQGVALGTRFYASLEAAGRPEAKARIVSASGEETTRSTIFDISRRHIWPAPYTGRVLTNDHARKWTGRESTLLEQIEQEHEIYMAARSRGDYSIAAVIAGESAGLINDIPSAGNIVRRISAQADALLSRSVEPSPIA
jgi:nitronate monooxygenase